MIIESITIIFAMMLEATAITWPERGLIDRLPFLKRRNVWGAGMILATLLLTLCYMAFSFIWFLNEQQPFRFCGGVLVTISFLEFIAVSRGIKKPPFLKRLDGAICFVCLSLIGYARFLWGF